MITSSRVLVWLSVLWESAARQASLTRSQARTEDVSKRWRLLSCTHDCPLMIAKGVYPFALLDQHTPTRSLRELAASSHVQDTYTAVTMNLRNLQANDDW
jgi:hypothetical protein